MTRWRIGFDLDDTLMAGPYGRLWFRPWVAAREREAGVAPGTFLRRLRDAGAERWRRGEWVAAYDWPDMVREELGVVLPDPPVPDVGAARALVAPGAYRLLAWLWDRRVELVLVTNGFWRLQRPYLDALGWQDIFSRYSTPDLAGAAKPDPRIFDGVGPLSLFVGDRPWQDGLGAVRAGIPVALVGPGPRSEERWDPLGRIPEGAWRAEGLDRLVRDLEADRLPIGNLSSGNDVP